MRIKKGDLLIGRLSNRILEVEDVNRGKMLLCSSPFEFWTRVTSNHYRKATKKDIIEILSENLKNDLIDNFIENL